VERRLNVLTLVEQYSPFIKGLTGKLYVKYGKRYDYEDILSVAYIAAIEAEKTFDPKIGEFSSYIRPAIERAVINNVLEITTDQLDLLMKAYKFINHHVKVEEVTPSITTIAKALDTSEEILLSLFAKVEHRKTVSYESIEVIGDEEDVFELSLVTEEVMAALNKIKPEYKQALMDKYVYEKSTSTYTITQALKAVRKHLDIEGEDI